MSRGEAREFDFLFNSYPAQFVGTRGDFPGFVSATAAGRR